MSEDLLVFGAFQQLVEQVRQQAVARRALGRVMLAERLAFEPEGPLLPSDDGHQQVIPHVGFLAAQPVAQVGVPRLGVGAAEGALHLLGDPLHLEGDRLVGGVNEAQPLRREIPRQVAIQAVANGQQPALDDVAVERQAKPRALVGQAQWEHGVWIHEDQQAPGRLAQPLAHRLVRVLCRRGARRHAFGSPPGQCRDRHRPGRGSQCARDDFVVGRGLSFEGDIV